MQHFPIVLDDGVGRLLVEDLVRGLSDQLIARQAQEVFAGPIDQNVSQAVRVLDEHGHRNVVDYPIEKVAIAITFLLGAPTVGDVFVSGHAKPAFDHAADDGDRSPVGGLHRPAMRRLPGNAHILLGVAGHAAGREVVLDQFPPARAACHHVGGHPVDFHVSLVAENHAILRIAQQQSLRHVVERDVELQLLSTHALARATDSLHQLAHDEKDEAADRQAGQADRADDGLRVPRPLRERGRRGRRDRDHQRIMRQCLQGGQLVLALGARPDVQEWNCLGALLPDRRLAMGTAAKQNAVAAEQVDCNLVSN